MRRTLHKVLLAPSVVVMSGCATVLFNDDFESDTVGAAPALTPPGEPPDDALSLQGAPGSFDELDRLRFEYQATILEALPGVYVVDEVTVKQ